MKKLNLFALGMISLGLVSCGGESTEEAQDDIVTETYELNLDVSNITWTGDYFKGDSFDHNHVGTVLFNSGSIQVANGVIQSGTFELNMNSIDENGAPMGEETKAKFVGHLKGEDFFYVEKYPTATVTLSECTASTLKGTIKVRDAEMPFEAPASIMMAETEGKITGDFKLDFAPLKIPYIGAAGDPEYVSPNVSFSLGMKFSKK